MSSQWYYTIREQRFGPTDIDDLRGKLARREVSWTELVWTEGMPNWRPASAVPILAITDSPRPIATPAPASGNVPFAAPASAPASAPAQQYASPYGSPFGGQPGGEVNYFRSSVNEIPPRAAAALKGHAEPVGDTADWPLDDSRIAAFEEAVRHRKQITAAANLYKGLFALSLIGTVVLVIAALVVLSTGNSRGTSNLIALGGGMAPTIGVTVLYLLGWRATARSKRWAPITIFVLCLLIIALYIVVIVAGIATGGRDVMALVIGGVFIILLFTAFAVTSWRALAAIPRYRATPAWCQELALRAKI